MAGSYLADLASQVTFLIALTVSLNLLLGFAGQMSMATAAFYGLGAYTCAVLTAQGASLTGQSLVAPQLPFVGGFVGAVLVTFAAGLIVAAPAARRVRGDYLILLTLAFHFLFVTVTSTWVDLTGGPNGMMLPPLSFFGFEITTTDQAFWLVLAWAIIASLVCWRIGASPFGRILRGIREDEVALQALGKPTVWPKSLTFGLTAAIAGATGAVSAAYMQFVAPTTYSLDLAILVAACVALGGAGNILGSVIAAAIIGSLRPILENTGLFSSDTAVPWQTVIYGAILVLCMVFRPAGLLPEGVGLPSRRPRKSIAAEPLKVVDFKRTEKPAARPNEPDPDVVVDVRNLSRSFGGLKAAQNVSFTLRKGEIVALIGPNGAGKSTIFNLMTGAIRPDEGDVILRGRSLLGEDPCRVANLGMARYFQHVRILEGLTAIDNVALGVPDQAGERLSRVFLSPAAVARREREVQEEAIRQLHNVGAADYAGETARDLAFGQQKLIAFARLLATGADVLLLDEPTSGVDPRSAEQIIELVRTLAQSGKTICIVEHSLHVVSELADRIVFMDAGTVVGEGTVAEITGRQDLVELYFGT
ncbi:branched-chain amino acid ABC transporter ATP-binding protein/permease [Shinella sp.]|uniref:branched-chain amino acid ABC transporter ATP-binding protein/permease n=1 Tax=Shinella sp. TaxID=1870904 RepID=UPI0029B6D75F|nr:branched-chain amino acid ABC transporter ATP-binding protein/permease [Shinella sp.]MDX3978600.1 branched-chain amino acid ABC transporter ATP-binding protein/permease [Shinella sp.]